MRLAVAAVAICLCGCGYMGNVLPPALNRPVPVQDLAAVERGSQIIIHFTVPTITTDGLPLKKSQTDIELRAGLPPTGNFTPDQWLAKWLPTTDRIPVVVGNDPLATVTVPAAKYYGKTVDIAVNVHGAGGHTAGWSRFAIVDVVPALPTPSDLVLSDVPDAVHLEWRAMAPEFRIFRKLVPDVNWMQIGTSTTPSYTDRTIEYGTTYQYFVQAVEKTADGYDESDLSDVRTIKPVDTFPPAAPVGVTAVPGARSIELVWERNTEKDFGSYRVYRDGKQIADGLTAPTYSDRDVKPKITYRYQVSAVDTAGNPSPLSPAVTATIP